MGLLAGVAVVLAVGAVPDVPVRVRIAEPALADAVRLAVEGAARRVSGASDCAAIFADFEDASGRRLQENLDLLGTSGAEYLRLVAFHDGRHTDGCLRRGRTLAVTMRASRVVWVCPAFVEAQRLDPGLAEVTVLHETLHSLGLGEDPPSANEITQHVVRRCGR